MDVRDTILSLFPQARITSGYRDPKSRLGRANPRSYHNVGRAYDVAPIPGVAFDDYVSKLKGAGVNVVEALDEQKNPLPHTTGPNWHIAYGDAKPMRPPNPILAALANYNAMSKPVNGVDPLAPQGFAPQGTPPQNMNEVYQRMMQSAGGPMSAQPNFAAMSQPQGGVDPLAPKKKGSTAALIMGVLGDALSAYGGQRGVFAPMMAQQQQMAQEENMFQRRLAAETQRDLDKSLRDARKPIEHTNSAGDVLRIDPTTGQPTVIYADPYGKPRTESRVNPVTGALEVFNTGSTPRPTADDIEDLRRDPSLARDFEAEFGPGTAAYFLRMGGR